MDHKFNNVNKILVMKMRHIGDVLLTVPVFRALRENFPGAHIAALVNSGTEEVLSGNPLIDEMIVFDRGIKKLSLIQKFSSELSFLRQIRDRGFDMTVDLTSGDRPALISLISGARYRIAQIPGKRGFPGKKHVYTHLARKNGSQHKVVQNLDILRQAGIDTGDLDVDFFIPEDARTYIKKVFKENNLTGNDKIVLVHPTSRWLFKCWDDGYMAEVIIWLLGRGIKVIVTSSPESAEMEKAKKILSLCMQRGHSKGSPLLDLCGRTTIKQLAALIAESDLFFGVDSAPMHMAAAIGTPVVVLFGPTVDRTWGPWYGRAGKSPHTVVKRQRGCRRCKAFSCEDRVCRYLLDIKPEEIINILKGKNL